ncbi:MAG: WecB/TagA/CpsF family glycosyltransferase, partial [Marinoscillum sp.]
MPKVLDIDLYAGNISTAITQVLTSEETTCKCISATGAHGLVTAKRDLKFKEILNSFYLNLPDGMPGVWVGRNKGYQQMKRCYGPDFFKEFMLKSADHHFKHFLCGGSEGVAENLKWVCETKFLNQNVVGTYCPPFLKVEEYDYPAIADRINESGADVVWIGLSTPKQECFGFYLSKYLNSKFVICVGAAFYFNIWNVRQAPSWI